MLEAAAHGLIAAILAFVLTLIAGMLPVERKPTLVDAMRVGFIVFCVAAGHTAGIAAGHPWIGIMLGALAGLSLAAIVPGVHARRRA